MSAGWLVQRLEDDGEVHVIPIADTVLHDAAEDCACRPQVEMVPNPNGPDGWMYVHDAADGRD